MFNISSFAKFIYTVILRPRIVKRLVNTLIKAIIPSHVNYYDVNIAINPNDPVISGALFFRVYEKPETKFVQSHLTTGDLFIDIGANIGYYTALASTIVTSTGCVLACEPDPDSIHYLKKTISNCRYNNIILSDYAISSTTEKRTLYRSDDNHGDNRLYSFPEMSNCIEIQCTTLDTLIDELIVKLPSSCFIKMDIQGNEGYALQGMQRLFTRCQKITIMMEFWPQGLIDAGTQPEEVLSLLEKHHFELFELDEKGQLATEFTDSADLIKRYPGKKYTNIIAIKKQ